MIHEKHPLSVGVLANAKSWYFRDLARASADLGIDIDLLDFSSLTSSLSRNELLSAGTTDLAQLDAIIVRTMPRGSLEQIIFRMDVLHSLQHAGQIVMNPPRALEFAIDKYLTFAKLNSINIRLPETFVCEKWKTAMEAFHQLQGNVVVKPIFGGEGRGILHIQREQLAETSFKTLERLGAVIYVQKYIKNPGFDIRVLCVGHKLWAIKRSNTSDWRNNVSQGAQAEKYELDDMLIELTFKIKEALNLETAGIDFMPDNQGNWYLLEVNAVPGWQATAEVHQHDIAAETLSHLKQIVLMNHPH